MKLTLCFLMMSALGLVACAKSGATADQASIPQGLHTQDSQTSGIIGGVLVSPSNPLASTVVSIISQYTTPGQPPELCTGSILSSNIIITAAHCVYGLQPGSVRIFFGTNVSQMFTTGDLTQIISRPVAQIVVHGWYGRMQDAAKDINDIALLGFAGGLPQGFQPAAFLQDASVLQDREPVLLAGYGRSNGHPPPAPADPTAHRDPLGAGILREVVVPIKTARWSNHETLVDQSLQPPKGACQGDSGGPAYVYAQGQTLLFGLTSRPVIDPVNGDGAQSTDMTVDYCNHYTAYTVILAYKNWISKKITQINNHQQAADDDGGAAQDPLSKYGPHRKYF